MNIQITPNFQLKSFQNQQPRNNSPIISPKYLHTLEKDTVSFGSGAKVLETRTKEVSWKLVNEIHDELEPMTKKLVATFKKEFESITANKLHPQRPVFGIHGRAKGPDSLANKGISRGCKSKDKIKNIGDAIGLRITMGNSSQDAFDKAFGVLGVMVKKGIFKVKEIENYRLTRKDSYVSSKTLDKFEETCQSMKQYPLRSGKAIPNGYTAVHLTIELPGGQLAEVQIMGKGLEDLKDLEDFYYKHRCHKSLDKKYARIQKMLDEKMNGLDDMQQEFLNKYILDSYVHAKNLTSRSPKQRAKISDFLPIPYFIPQELGFANLHKMKEECDLADKTLKEAAKTAKQAKKANKLQ